MSLVDEEREELTRLRAEVEVLRAQLEARSEAPPPMDERLALHRSVLASMTEGVVAQATDGRIISCNGAAERILGLSQDQLSGRTSTDPRWRAIRPDGSAFPGEEHPAMVTLRTGEPQRGVIMGVHKPTGELTWISINSHPLRDAEGHQSGVVATFTDITKAREATAALHASEERLRLALRAARMGIWSWDVASDAVVWSEALAEMFGVSLADFDGSYDAYMASVHPDDREVLIGAIQEALADREIGERYEVEHRVLHPDGKARWIRAFGRVLRDAEGEPTGMLGTAVDVTEHKALEAQLLQAQKMESVGRLAGGVAHDFNNLMTAVLGAAQLGLRRTDLDPQVRRYLSMIEESAHRASGLTAQLLAFARQQVLQLSAIRPSTLLIGMESLLRRVIGEDIELRTELESRAYVRADRTQLEQVIVNLAVNARDAMRGGGVLILRCEDAMVDAATAAEGTPLEPGPHVRISVTDSGIGMNEEQRARAFEPFFTTKPSGSGLGLATCYGIVTQLGGRIELRSEPGMGTTVAVWLPMVEADKESSATDTRTPVRRGDETIVVVEDEALVREITVQSLASAGYRVLDAEHAERALELLAEHRGEVDLVVSDVVLPGMNGAELAERVRADHPSVKVLLVSGYAGDALAQRGALPGDVVLLPKPYDGNQLAQRVRALLDA